MHRKLHISLLAFLIGGFSCISSHAVEQPAGAEAKLRDALRSTMTQLRDVQTQLVAVQAEKAEFEEKAKDFEAKLKKRNQEADEDKLKFTTQITVLNSDVTAKKEEIEKLNGQADKARQEIAQKTKLQAATEEKRKAFEEKAIMLDRRVAEQQAKNAAIYKIGLEILSRYEKFGLGDAISAREPFIGATRVKFQNLVQDFGDKLSEQKIKPVADARRGSAEASPSSQKDQKAKAEEPVSKKKAKPADGASRPRD